MRSYQDVSHILLKNITKIERVEKTLEQHFIKTEILFLLQSNELFIQL